MGSVDALQDRRAPRLRKQRGIGQHPCPLHEGRKPILSSVVDRKQRGIHVGIGRGVDVADSGSALPRPLHHRAGRLEVA